MSIALRAELQRQPVHTIFSQSIAHPSSRSSQSLNPPQTDKTTSKLTKTAHSKLTISRKTLNFLPTSQPENNLASRLSLQPFRQSARQPTQAIQSQHRRTRSNEIEQTRTRRTANNRRGILPSTDKITPKANNITPKLATFTPKLAKSDHHCPPRTDDLLQNTGFPRDLRHQEKKIAETPSAHSQSLAHDPPNADPPGLNRSAAHVPRR